MRHFIVTVVCACAAVLVATGPVGTAFAQASSTATGVSRLMNPAVSANALFLAQSSSDDDSYGENNIALQEAEMQFSAVVDPFWKANLIVAFHPPHHEEAAAKAEEHHAGFEVHLEEASLTSRSMPAGLGLRIGKFFLPFGKHAPLHTHQFPFVRAPLPLLAFLGDHGLTDVGAELSATVPAPWYSVAKVYGIDGGVAILDGEDRDLAYGGRLINLWDVSDNATLELGLSALTGPAGPGMRQLVYGADLTYKWSSGSLSHGPAVNWINEVVLPDPDGKVGNPVGAYSLVQYRFARNWWLGLGGGKVADTAPVEGFESVNLDADGLVDYSEFKANVTFTPSEFSDLRAEVSYAETDQDGYEDLRFSIQWNFTIGAHPAHLY